MPLVTVPSLRMKPPSVRIVRNNNSGGGRGRGNGAGRGNGGGRGRGGGRGNGDPDYQRKAWETQGIKVDSDGVLKVNCRVCGLNTTHS